MPVRNNAATMSRSQSELDRHAIAIAAHAVVAGIWLERRLVEAPKILVNLVARTNS
jgi:hypothetical protein